MLENSEFQTKLESVKICTTFADNYNFSLSLSLCLCVSLAVSFHFSLTLFRSISSSLSIFIIFIFKTQIHTFTHSINLSFYLSTDPPIHPLTLFPSILAYINTNHSNTIHVTIGQCQSYCLGL